MRLFWKQNTKSVKFNNTFNGYSVLLTYLLTYLLTPWCRVLLEKLTVLQLVKNFPTFHGTRRFITALTSVRHLSLSRASPIQSTYPYPTSWRSVLILSTHLRLGFPIGLFTSGFPTKTLLEAEWNLNMERWWKATGRKRPKYQERNLRLWRRSTSPRLLWLSSYPVGVMHVSCECCVLLWRGLCVGLITRPEEYYRVWCVWVWSWIFDNEEVLAHWGLL